MLTSVLPHRTVSRLQGVVEEVGDDGSNKGSRGEGDVHHVIEPSGSGVNRTVLVDSRELVEILRNRQAQEDGDAQYELGSEAVEVAELKKA